MKSARQRKILDGEAKSLGRLIAVFLEAELRRGRLHRRYSNGKDVTATSLSTPRASYPTRFPGTRLDCSSRLRLWDSAGAGEMRIKRVQPTLLGHREEFT